MGSLFQFWQGVLSVYQRFSQPEWFFHHGTVQGSQRLLRSEALLWYTQLSVVLGVKLSSSWLHSRNVTDGDRPPLDVLTALVTIAITIPIFCVAPSNLSPVAPFPRHLCWFGVVLFQGRFSLLPFLLSISLLYSAFRASPLFLSSGSAILTCTGRRFHSVWSSATNSRTTKPSLRKLPFVLWPLKPISYASFFRAAFKTAGYHPLG